MQKQNTPVKAQPCLKVIFLCWL